MKISQIKEALIFRIIGKLQRSIGLGAGAFDCANEVQTIANLFRELGEEISPDMLIIDVGGNSGEWTYEALTIWPNSKFLIFEPSTTASKILTNNFNSFKNVSVVTKALSDSVGTASLFSDIPGSGLGSLAKREISYLGINFNFSENVEVDTLDNILETNPTSLAILKIDVEGYELAVLRGSTRLFCSKNRPKVVQFEFGGASIDTRVFFKDFWNFFNMYEYKIYRIGKRSLFRINEYSENLEIFKTTNFIAVCPSILSK